MVTDLSWNRWPLTKTRRTVLGVKWTRDEKGNWHADHHNAKWIARALLHSTGSVHSFALHHGNREQHVYLGSLTGCSQHVQRQA